MPGEVPSTVDSAVSNWLPPGRRAAVCFSIDDVHPGKSSDAYEAGGDLDRGMLRHLVWLLERHPQLEVTLFIPADWREIAPFPTRRLLAAIPGLRDRFFLSRVLPKGTMRLDSHPKFVRFLQGMPRTHLGLHGLYHVHRGPKILVEFQDESVEQCRRTLERAIDVFNRAGIDFVPGMCPPAWNAPPNLVAAMSELGLRFLASARDVLTPVSRSALAGMSGMRGVSMVYPQLLQNKRIVQLTSNFAANNSVDRATAIIEINGLLAVKAHAIKQAFGHVSVDGLDEHYCNYLDVLFSALEDRYGDSLWWTSMNEVADSVLESVELQHAAQGGLRPQNHPYVLDAAIGGRS